MTRAGGYPSKRRRELKESGGTTLAMGSVSDGQRLVRSGSTIAGETNGLGNLDAASATLAELAGLLSDLVTATTGNTIEASGGTLVNSVRAYGNGETQVEGLALVSTSEATGVADEYSPILVLGGEGHKSNAPAESQSVRFGWQVRPTAGAAAAAGALHLLRSLNGGAWTDSGMPYFKSDGLHYIPILVASTALTCPSIACTGDPSASSGQFKLSNAAPVSPGSTGGSTPNKPDGYTNYVWVKCLTSDNKITYLLGIQA